MTRFTQSALIYSRNINLIYKSEELLNRNKTDQIQAKQKLIWTEIFIYIYIYIYLFL